ncbi:uncharacterized protein LOC141877610 [Acropora palmata]|uniref:uncharacterized protein LOC141877610 n=1 Tax=Acropora palmata TaxID=6131 RepID=UPI003DA0415D
MKLTVMITSYVFIAAISFLPRYIYPCLDPSLQETVGRNIFLEHRNFVLNVPISILLTTHDSTACALECLHRSQRCRSFNFAINPASGNCKLLSTDKYKEEEEFKPSSFYNHYSITSPCEFKPCKNGVTCHPLYESNEFLCEEWIKLNKNRVCFGAKNDAYGSFTIPPIGHGYLKALKLVYRSGYVTCKKTPVLRSHWGCEVDSEISIFVTDNQNKVQFPQDYSRSSYILPGYHKNSTELGFSALFSPLFVREGMEFRIWYVEDYKNGKEYDNSGRTCTDVYGFY